MADEVGQALTNARRSASRQDKQREKLEKAAAAQAGETIGVPGENDDLDKTISA